MTVILSITFLQFSFCEGGWGARIADYFQRLVSNLLILFQALYVQNIQVLGQKDIASP